MNVNTIKRGFHFKVHWSTKDPIDAVPRSISLGIMPKRISCNWKNNGIANFNNEFIHLPLNDSTIGSFLSNLLVSSSLHSKSKETSSISGIEFSLGNKYKEGSVMISLHYQIFLILTVIHHI